MGRISETNIPDDVKARMRELHEAGAPKDYYGGPFFGDTGWFETDRMLDAHKAAGWELKVTVREVPDRRSE